MTSFKVAAIKILKNSKNPLHYKGITEIAIKKWLIETSWKTPELTMNAYINQDIKDFPENSFFIGLNEWYFAFNHECTRNIKDLWLWKTKEERRLDKKEFIKSQFTWKWWEYAVCSELLFRWFYAALMWVDDWIDIIATKNKKQYLIQVKTSNTNKNWKYNFSIQKKSFDRYSDENVYYIFLLHEKSNNTFFIMNNKELKHFLSNKKTSNVYNICIENKGSKYVIHGKVSTPNNWDTIK